MLDRKSALSGESPFDANQLKIWEKRDLMLCQVAGSEAALKAALGAVPATIGVVLETNGTTLLRTGPRQIWVLGNLPAQGACVYVTALSSSRVCIVVEGNASRSLLSKCAPIDFHLSTFKAGQFAMTGIHHMPVVIQCVSANSFHIYGLRTFARTLWEMLIDAAAV